MNVCKATVYDHNTCRNSDVVSSIHTEYKEGVLQVIEQGMQPLHVINYTCSYSLFCQLILILCSLVNCVYFQADAHFSS